MYSSDVLVFQIQYITRSVMVAYLSTAGMLDYTLLKFPGTAGYALAQFFGVLRYGAYALV